MQKSAPGSSSATPLEIIDSRYALQRLIGQGGMGEVYEAFDRLNQESVALKRVTVPGEQLIFATQAGQAASDFRVSLAQEFKILASLRHPHIISVLDYGFDDQRRPYYTMELLHEAHPILEAARRQPVAERIRMLIKILQALTYLHRRGIIHRDLKPGNVLVIENHVKVLDFGLAMGQDNLPQEESDTAAGTIAYMAPEVIRGRPASVASDLYAVGVMAYQLLAGKHPFETDSISKLMMAMVTSEPDLSALDDISTSDLNLVPDIEDHDAATLAPTRQQSPAQEELDTLPLETRLSHPRPFDEVTTTKGPSAAEDDDEPAPRPARQAPARPDETASPKSSLAMIIHRLLAKDPAARYQRAEEVIIDLCQATGLPAPVESAAIRESYLQTAVFVGREAELQQLSEALTDAIQRQRGSAWLVGGESGVGKSRLLDELRIQALVEGATVARGQGIRERGVPYQVWHEPLRWLAHRTPLDTFEASVLKAVVPDIGLILQRDVPDPPELDSQATQNRLVGVVEDLIRRQEEPVVLILEDLQWAGSESITILSRLAQIVSETMVMLVGSFRDDERPALLDDLSAMRFLKLQRLETDHIARLSESILGEAGRDQQVVNLLQRETEGNVFFLVEVIRALAEEAGNLDDVAHMTLPKTVFAGGIQRIIQQRLALIPPQARALLAAAAVAGRQLDRAVLKAATEQAPALRQPSLDDWFTLCDNAAILAFQDGHWQFVHDKLREQLLADLDDTRRADLHRIIARAIEQVYGDAPSHIARLAHHWQRAGHAANAIKYLDKAGEQALSNYANQEAIAFLQDAQKLDTPTADTLQRRTRREVMLGQAYLNTGKLGESRDFLLRALDMMGYDLPQNRFGFILSLLAQVGRQLRHRLVGHRTTSNPAKREELLSAARIYDELTEVYFYYSQSVYTIYCAIKALNLAEGAGVSVELARAYANLTVAAGLVPIHRLAVIYRENAIQTALELDDPSTLATALSRTSLYDHGNGHWTRAHTSAQEALRIAESLGDQRQWGETMMIYSSALHIKGAYRQAKDLYGQLLEAGTRRGDLQHQVWGLGYQAQCTIKLNEIAESQMLLTACVDVAQDFPAAVQTARLVTQGLQCIVHLRQGDVQAAQEAIDVTASIVRQRPDPSSYAQFEGYAAISDFYLTVWEHLDELGEGYTPEQLRAEAEEGCTLLKGMSKRFPITYARYWVNRGRLAALDGNLNQAAQSWQKALDYAETYDLPYEKGLAHYYMGSRLDVDTPTRQTHLEIAGALLKGIEAAYEAAMAHQAKDA